MSCPTTTTDMSSALQAMTGRGALSRNRLRQIIDEFDLYPREKQRFAPEELIGLMKRNIGIQPLEPGPQPKDFSAFKISFVSDNPYLAQQVTSRLTSLFIQENLKTRENQATNTTNFLSTELESAQTRLTEQEHRLRDFKMSYLGELPEHARKLSYPDGFADTASEHNGQLRSSTTAAVILKVIGAE